MYSSIEKPRGMFVIYNILSCQCYENISCINVTTIVTDSNRFIFGLQISYLKARSQGDRQTQHLKCGHLYFVDICILHLFHY